MSPRAPPDGPRGALNHLNMQDVIAGLTLVDAKVFLILCTYLPDPIPLSANDIMDFGGMSRQSVSDALRSLCRSELVQESHTGHRPRRYRPNPKYFHYRAGAFDMRGRLESHEWPDRPDHSEPLEVITEPNVYDPWASPSVVVQKIGSSSFIDQSKEEDPEKQQQNLPEVRSILAEAGIHGKLLDTASASLSPDKAIRIFREWIQSAPKHIRKPAVYAARCLSEDPDWQPEAEMSKQTWFSGFEGFVNR